MATPMNLTEKINFLREKSYKLETFEKVKEIDYNNFFKEYLLANKPCIFTPDVTMQWKSRKDWVMENHTPNYTFLRALFGDAIVPVANCKQEQYSSHPKQDILLSEYLDYWEKYRVDGYPEDEPRLYLKDWHFTKAYPDYKAYTTPVYFLSDWLNEFWDTLPQDDYRFVYMGPKGTWTPFHADVYRSFSWSANICGKKKWIFYPPGCEVMLKDNLGNLVYDVTSPDLENQKKFPNAFKVKGQMLEVIQGEGQIIFVPSGWHHQVYNLEDTISINHNWLNGCNIDICWKHLHSGLQDVKKEIEHCRDMDGWNTQCQLILKACAGIDYKQFLQMLRVIAENRIEQHKKQETSGAIAELCIGNTGIVAESQPLDNRKQQEMQENNVKEIYMSEKCSNEISELEKERTKEQKEVYTKRSFCDKKEFSLPKELWEHFAMFAFSSDWEWSENDYLIFDLYRIRHILQVIISDEDYKSLYKEYNDSAEYIIDIIESWKTNKLLPFN
ncbi:2-oxoglutarate and iron-dependent oxygenase JMJD4-like [Mercenaria mercenaria]|uniref:2-oxoglutarate and iron-dependent oxygenase JMJD4-like n=1 Tax=Mercenaria mercenaria TaxID=6596 RepID=UPI00234EF3FD|nr:2-oxoglutarate and iron-dependent oxygenase JMJD4-like [Mercenaria mercenaria]